MSIGQTIELEASKVWFYSRNDEAAFFEWLKKIPCVRKVEGSGASIYIAVEIENVSDKDLRELLAIFHRYAISMKQLVVFDCDKFASWFRDKRAYWYASVFE